MRKQREFRHRLLAAACFCGSAFLLTSAHSGGLGGAGGLGLGTDGGGLASSAGAAIGAGLNGSVGQTGVGMGGTIGASAAVGADVSGTKKATNAAAKVVSSTSERKAAVEHRLHASAQGAKAFAVDRATGAGEELATNVSASVDAQASGQAKASKQDRAAGVDDLPQMPPRR